MVRDDALRGRRNALLDLYVKRFVMRILMYVEGVSCVRHTRRGSKDGSSECLPATGTTYADHRGATACATAEQGQ
jgi:hypothetical protein